MKESVIFQQVIDPRSEEIAALKSKKLARVIDALYKAIVFSNGLYKTITIETHAPQRIYYPGAIKVQIEQKEASSQLDLFGRHDATTVEKEKTLLEVLEPGTLLHRRWLWFATLTDRREESLSVYKAHCKIYADYPQFYTKDVAYISLNDFRAALDKKYKIGSPKDSAGYWQICALTLFKEFDGDPVMLLKHAGWSVQSVMHWKKTQKKPIGKGGRGYDPIPGWGPKLVSLYFLYLAELGFPLPDDAFPSDVHAQAIVMQVGAFDYKEKESVTSASFAEQVRVFFTEYCKKKKYDVLLLAHASWLLGSTLCENCSRRIDVSLLCPIYKECSGRVDTSHYWKAGLWPKKIQRMNKGGQRPPYGIPTDISPRLTKRGEQEIHPVIHLFPLRRVK